MTTAPQTRTPWSAWLDSWDTQQSGYLPDREGRFTVMLDALEAVLPEDFVAVDLACGPGSVSQRLLARFPAARSVAVDLDPVLLTLGRGALGECGGRLRWVEADLRTPGWTDALGVDRVDAVLTSTALHWLTAPELLAVYRTLADLIRPGGLFLNGDHLHYGTAQPTLAGIAATVTRRRHDQAFAPGGTEDWAGWWDRMAREGGELLPFAERERRFADRQRGFTPPDFAAHHAALTAAGFAEVDVLWQNLDNRVLAAVR